MAFKGTTERNAMNYYMGVLLGQAQAQDAGGYIGYFQCH